MAAAGAPLALLQQEFPELPTVVFNGYTIRYSKKFLWLSLLWQAPKLFFGIVREHQQLKAICAAQKIDVVLSDNRFGCWNSDLTSIFISHQVFIRSPFFQNVIRSLNFWVMKRYTHVWIPDDAGEPNLSGELSHEKKIPLNASYIGVLSRFANSKNVVASNSDYRICVLLSGPEPQRTVLENLLVTQLVELKTKAIVVRGLPTHMQQKSDTENLTFKNHLSTKELQRVLNASEIIVCRSGYSSVMDFAILGKKAIFIPTPGQTEQEYLARYFSEQKICFTESQNNFDLKTALLVSVNYSGFDGRENKLDLSSFDL